MGFRFQKRFSILPGLLRINLSKGGVSASVGPRGADVNIGKKGITTSAGIPGSGLSYRSTMGHKGAGLGVLLLAAGLAYWGYTHFAKVEKAMGVQKPAAVTQQASPAAPPTAAPGSEAVRKAADSSVPGPRYVHRDGSVLRDQPKSSGKTLKKEAKGVVVTVTAVDADGWATVTDGDITGYMRASVLSPDKP
jgi:uncharacterized protein YgiM (DUF1202 family)